MKKTILLITLLFCSISLLAQPNKISYQGVLTDNNGALVNGTKNLVFRVYNAESTGTLLATDTHNGVTISNGLFSVELNIGSINFSQNLWLEITVEGMVLTPRIAFNANGYSLAGKAYSLQITTNAGLGNVLTSDANGNANWTTHVLVPNGTTSGQMLYWNGTAWVIVAAGSNGQILKYINGVPTWATLQTIDVLSVGDSFQGGIIAYFLQPGDPGYDANVRHGIIAAPSDQITEIQWYNGNNITIGATSTAIGTGNANTNIIVTTQGAGSYAAKLCADLVLGGYSDWYLPSLNELSKLYANADVIGGFSKRTYWSSSEHGYDTAYCIDFYYGYGYYTYKSDAYYNVRAVRSF